MANVLVPLDDSELSSRALEHAVSEHPDANVTLIHVVDPLEVVYEAEKGGPSLAAEWYETAAEEAEAMFTRACERVGLAEADVRTELVVGRPGREIVQYAEENDVDHVVMGSHGRSGVDRLLLGSVAETVVRRSPVPVTVVR